MLRAGSDRDDYERPLKRILRNPEKIEYILSQVGNIYLFGFLTLPRIVSVGSGISMGTEE